MGEWELCRTVTVGYPTRGTLLITNQAWLRAHLATAGAPLSPQAEVTPPQPAAAAASDEGDMWSSQTPQQCYQHSDPIVP
jgi:hypothetical protein